MQIPSPDRTSSNETRVHEAQLYARPIMPHDPKTKPPPPVGGKREKSSKALPPVREASEVELAERNKPRR